MSTATVTRLRRRSTPTTDPQAPIRRARTRLLLAPTLAALRLYRAQIVEHCDQTIERLEALEAWCDGAELPDWAAHLGKLFPGIDAGEGRREYDDSMETLANENNTVVFCECACEQLARTATGHAPGTLQSQVDHLARCLRASNTGDSTMDEVEELFMQTAERDGGALVTARTFEKDLS